MSLYSSFTTTFVIYNEKNSEKYNESYSTHTNVELKCIKINPTELIDVRKLKLTLFKCTICTVIILSVIISAGHKLDAVNH